MNSKVTFQILLTVILMFSQTLKAQNTQTLQLRPGPQDGYDVDIRTDNLSPNWLSKDVIANAWTVSGNPFIQRSILKFDLSQIPSDAQIIRAHLSLFCNTTTGHHQHQSGENACYLERVTQSWDQYTVNWSNQPSTTTVSAVILPKSNDEFQDYPDIDITNFVAYWHQNPEMNYGMLLKLISENQYNCLVFASSNNLDETKRPLLVIEYTGCNPPIDQYNYEIDGLNCQFNYSDTTTTEWHWDFGDNTTSTLQNPLHIYTSAGTYVVTLTAINECGQTTMSDTITICNKPVSDFTYRTDGQIVAFKSLATNAEAWYWSFGNGFFSNLENPVYHYLQTGTYQVCLLVTNRCGSDIHCERLTVEDQTVTHASDQNDEIETTPNPTVGEVKISDNNNQTIYRIDVCNTSGLLVSTIENINATSVSIDISNVEAGVYIIKVVTSGGEYSKMVIKR